jgi:hypothetical protein
LNHERIHGLRRYLMRMHLFGLVRRLGVATTLAALALSVTTASAQSATHICVGGASGCYVTIQAALAGATDGDIITIAPGTYAGPITITKSVQLIGAGSALTTIEGGGPVLTIGDGSTKPTVSVTGVTVTGGLTTSNRGHGFAAGGGIEIPPLAADNSTGATVSIAGSIITGNRANPLSVVEDKKLCSLTPFDTCALAFGGGIDNSGDLTLTHTQVTNNVAGSTTTEDSVTTVARGGGIYDHPQGDLALDDSVVSSNIARATASDSYAARGGGILEDGVLNLTNSRVTGNRAEISSSLSGSIFVEVNDPGSPAHAVGGGIAIADDEGSATIANSTISDNSASASDTSSDAVVDAGGIDVEGSLRLNNSRVNGNQLTASTSPSSGANVAALGGGIESGGETATVTVNNSTIDNNTVQSRSDTGGSFTFGGGLAEDDTVNVHHTEVSHNSGNAIGSFGLAQGGGIINADYDNRLPHLTLIASDLTGNVVSGSPGILALGGGLFTAHPLELDSIPATLVQNQITGNQPDQCFGC